MIYQYTIKPESYFHIIEYCLRKRESTTSRKRRLFIMTYGQVCLVLCAVLIFPFEASERYLLMGLSLLTALTKYLYSRAYRLKAKFMLSGLKNAGQIPDDYWKLHTLRAEGNMWTLSYGTIRQEFPSDYIRHVEFFRDFILLMSDEITVLEAIPFSELTALQRDELTKSFSSQK